MSLEGFVRSAGAAMGVAREAFGADGVALTPAPGVGAAPTGFGDGSGRAATAFAQESGVLDGHVAALGEHDQAGEQQLREVLAAAGVGRGRMDAVIAAAEADVSAMGASTNTPAGQQALVGAIKRHLQDTKGTLDQADGDAGTRAAAANLTAAGYQGIGQPPVGGAAPAMAAMPQMPAMPQLGGMPMGGGLPLAPLAGLAGLLSQGHQPQTGGRYADAAAQIPGLGEAVSGAAGLPVGDVRYDAHGFPGGRGAYSTYISKALDVMGINDPVARANWTRGLETGLARESGFNPMAVNRSDSNAHGPRLGDGAPAGSSRGGLQTIPATFAAHHQPGTSTNIYDPVANIAAAMNYLMRRYHVQRDASNLSGVGQFNPHHAPHGY
jgi:hypothetical protein